jgi:hypothetical protein
VAPRPSSTRSSHGQPLVCCQPKPRKAHFAHSNSHEWKISEKKGISFLTDHAMSSNPCCLRLYEVSTSTNFHQPEPSDSSFPLLSSSSPFPVTYTTVGFVKSTCFCNNSNCLSSSCLRRWMTEWQYFMMSGCFVD